MRRGAVVEAGRPHPILTQAVEIEIGEKEPGSFRKALALGQEFGVLVDQRVSVPGEIRGRLARSGRGVEICRDAAAGLRGAQQPPVVRLADGGVAGGEIDQDRGAGERCIGAGRDRHPKVFADLDMDREAVMVGRGEDQIPAERHLVAPDRDGTGDGGITGGELPLLVELAVVRQICLRHHAENAAAVNDKGAVEQLRLVAQRGSRDDDRAERPAGRDELGDPGFHGIEERVLEEEVIVRIGGQPQLREDRDRCPMCVGLAGEIQRGGQVLRR